MKKISAKLKMLFASLGVIVLGAAITPAFVACGKSATPQTQSLSEQSQLANDIVEAIPQIQLNTNQQGNSVNPLTLQNASSETFGTTNPNSAQMQNRQLLLQILLNEIQSNLQNKNSALKEELANNTTNLSTTVSLNFQTAKYDLTTGTMQIGVVWTGNVVKNSLVNGANGAVGNSTNQITVIGFSTLNTQPKNSK